MYPINIILKRTKKENKQQKQNQKMQEPDEFFVGSIDMCET